jgi:hypothetical protein
VLESNPGATATNKPLSGDQQTERQLSLGDVPAVHVIPSGEVITPFVPEAATATNKPLSGDQHTEYHSFVPGVVLAVQVMPSGEVMTL